MGKLELRLVQFSATSLSTEAATRGKPLLSPDRYVVCAIIISHEDIYEDVYLIGFAQSFDIFVIDWVELQVGKGWEKPCSKLGLEASTAFCSFSLPALPRCFIFCHFFSCIYFSTFCTIHSNYLFLLYLINAPDYTMV